jgi:hypothetical protein
MDHPNQPWLDELHRCGARTRSGTPCKRPGRLCNGRRRMHGGASKVKHGKYTKKAMAEQRRVRELVRDARQWWKGLAASDED